LNVGCNSLEPLFFLKFYYIDQSILYVIFDGKFEIDLVNVSKLDNDIKCHFAWWLKTLIYFGFIRVVLILKFKNLERL